MSILQIGLGSMGRRRIRCLQALGAGPVTGFDPRADRRQQAAEELGVETVAELGPDAWARARRVVVSTPPRHHLEYLQAAVQAEVPAFVEVGVPDPGYAEVVAEARARGAFVAPSCTMRFHPAVQALKSLVADGSRGRITTFTYYMGQYLPDWHPWESIGDFYVSDPRTSGTREMTTFELTWLVDVVGLPEGGAALTGRTLPEMGAEIDDAYGLVLRYPRAMGTVMVDVVARAALRQLVLNTEASQIRWSWEENRVRVFDVEEGAWSTVSLPEPDAAPGYNPRIGEGMYVEEMRAFLEAADGGAPFPHTLEEDLRIRELVRALEGSDPTGAAALDSGG